VKTVQSDTKPYDLLGRAVKETGSWAAAIMTPNEKHGVLDCGPNVGFPEDWAHITNALDQTTGNGRCFLSGQPALIEGVPISQPDGGSTFHYMSAIVVVPIRDKGKVVGTLEVIKDTPKARFSKKEISLLEDIALNLSPYTVAAN
jgi:putative methionine-R-sulfoxide reductase with GAF domain